MKVKELIELLKTNFHEDEEIWVEGYYQNMSGRFLEVLIQIDCVGYKDGKPTLFTGE